MSALDFRVLGPVRVLRDGEDVRLGGGKPRGVLALLVANRNHTVSADALIAALWPDGEVADPAGSLQVVVSALRRAIGDTGGTVLQTQQRGYRLAVGDDACDVGRFVRRNAAGRAAARDGRHTEAADDYRAALAEWAGPAFSDLRGTRFGDDLAVSLEEDRLSTVEARIEADLQCGRHREVVGELSELTAAHPLRESLWAQYLLALYRCGRQADALAAARALRTALREELGLNPSEAVVRLEAAILRQDPELDRRESAPGAAAPTLAETAAARGLSAVLVAADGTEISVGARLTVGRAPSNGLVLDDPKVSREHAIVRRAGGGFLVTDLHSTNGTVVNGDAVDGHCPLRNGDIVGFGAAAFTVVVR